MKIETKFDIGQEVFFVDESDLDGKIIWDIETGNIESISIDKDAIWFYVRYKSGLTYWHKAEDYNKRVFATREEAEQKLKETGE